MRNRRGWSRALYSALFLLVVVIHIRLFLFFEPLDVLFSPHPLYIGDYYGHYYQILRFIEGMEGWGKTWVYDFQLLAGIPTNAISDANNKAWELWAYALYKMGVPVAVAFNSYLMLAHLFLLPVIYSSSRLFGLSRWGVLVAMMMGTSIWYFDSSTHICWFAGMASYTFAGYAFLLPVALFYRYLQDKRLSQAVLTAVLTGILHLIHAYIFLAMVIPMGVLYIRAYKSLNRTHHATVAGIIITVIAINAYWMVVAVEFFRYLIDSAFYGQSSLLFLLTDFFGILWDPMTTGTVGVRTGFRFLCFGAGLVTLFFWQRSKDHRFYVFAISIGSLSAMAYLGGYSSVTSQVQPYRFIYPACILSLIPAAGLIDALIDSKVFMRQPKLVYATIAVLALPGLQHLSRDVLYFFPDIYPKIDKKTKFLSSSGYPLHYRPFRKNWQKDDNLLSDWVKSKDDGIGRFLVGFDAVGEQLAWKTNAEIIGGFPYRNLDHAYANIFRPRKKEMKIETEAQFQDYLETYAIKWVIVPSDDKWFHQFPALLELETDLLGTRAYRTHIKPNKFQQGSGLVIVSLNRLEVRGTDPNEDIILRYNWVHTLECLPNCVIQRAINKFSTSWFIKIPAPHPADFEIYNGY